METFYIRKSCSISCLCFKRSAMFCQVLGLPGSLDRSQKRWTYNLQEFLCMTQGFDFEVMLEIKERLDGNPTCENEYGSLYAKQESK